MYNFFEWAYECYFLESEIRIYIHCNPAEAGFVTKAEGWKYSSALDYYGGQGLLAIMKLETLVI
ncbi:MAG: hypothetical protein ABI358_04105 [Ginsengibacter sp.]